MIFLDIASIVFVVFISCLLFSVVYFVFHTDFTVDTKKSKEELEKKAAQLQEDLLDLNSKKAQLSIEYDKLHDRQAELDKRINNYSSTLEYDLMRQRRSQDEAYAKKIKDFDTWVRKVSDDLKAQKARLDYQQSHLPSLSPEAEKRLEEEEKKLQEYYQAKEEVLAVRKKELELWEKSLKESEIKLSLKEADLITKYKIKNLQLKKEIEQAEHQKKMLDESQKEVLESSKWLASVYADFEVQLEEHIAHNLKYKKKPALSAAEEVKEAGMRRREAIYQAKISQYQLDYFITLFPWLEDYLEMLPSEAESFVQNTSQPVSEYDSVKNWLSPEEYSSMPTSEKWQLALDRYNKRQKSNWQVGIEYERYIGYLLELEGYKVRYFGATEGKEDMGRDLIAVKKNQRLIVQCKRWSQEKTIHEKHIFQLYGTTVLESLQKKAKEEIIGVFVTTATLSPLSLECADYLHIKTFMNVPFHEYPQIKCNISREHEKIYHLPFDQQYDTTQINYEDGDFYAETIQEAESKGFRRAYRWHGVTS